MGRSTVRLVLKAGLVAAMSLPACRAAHAQVAVEDVPTETSTGEIAGYTQQLVNPSQQTQTNTGNTATNTQNIEATLQNVPPTSSYFQGDSGAGASDSIINPMPDVSNVTSALNWQTVSTGQAGIQMGGGDGTLSSTATSLYGQNPPPKPGTDPVLDAQDGVLRVSSNIQGMAIDNLKQLQARLQAINDLISALSNAKDITTVETINARLSIAAVAVEAQEAQAANLTAIATAQSEINRENEAQAMRNEHVQTETLFSSLIGGLGGSMSGGGTP